MLLTLIKTLIALQSGFSPDGRYPPDYGPNLQNGDEFDFIVVGAGSAGSVVANRLSEISQWKVLVLEAGGYPSGMSEIPALSFSLVDSDNDWQFKMEPCKTCCLSVKDNVCKCPRGKGLGGSSTINILLYTRSTKYDHERWVNSGCDGWDHDSVVKYYKKLENVHIPNNNIYGTDGELNLTRYTSHQPLRQILEKAYGELGYSEYTEDNPIGFRDLLMSIYEGTRQNAAKAFLSPAGNRKNLYVATNAQVSRILVDPQTLTAFGVEVKVQGRILKLRANKEVIVSAGSIGSPHILMNSGIGPKEHLREHGIELIKDLRVGDNYQDHLTVPLLIVEVDHSAIIPISTFQSLKELYDYFAHRQGVFSGLEITNFGSYINTKNASNFANIQYLHGIVHQQDPYLIHEVLRATGASQHVSRIITEHNQKVSLLVLMPILLHPKSSGYIRLKDPDPSSEPLIIPNYLSDNDEEDINTLVDAIRLIQNLVETNAFANYNPKLIDFNITNCCNLAPQSDEYWKCAIRNVGYSLFHPIGTCKMGKSSDPSAVVDPQLRVRGIKGLRVIDASVMPLIPSSNTNAPTLMIGEKGADLIKEDWIKNKHDEL